MLWEPLALAALNQRTADAAAPTFARVLAEMFGSDPRAAAIALPLKPLHVMYAEPARGYIESRGGAVRAGSPWKVRIGRGGLTRVEAGGDRGTSGAVVSAVPWFALSELFEGDASGLSEMLMRARDMKSCPIVTVNLWFDRPVLDEPFVGLPGRAMQWVFDKQAAFGGDASHLSLVSSGATSFLHMMNQ